MTILELDIPGVPSTAAEGLTVRQIDIKESLNHPFQIAVIARSPNHSITLSSVVGQGIRVAVRPGEEAGGRVWTGICSFMQQLEAEPTGVSTYLIQVVPQLWLLSQKRSSRIFQHRTLPQIARAMLEAHGVPFQLVVDEAAFRRLEYRVQYNESDLEFFNRIVEEAGITYFFAADNGETQVMLTATPQARTPRSGALRFVGETDPHARDDVAYRAQISEAVVPGRYRVRDFDFRNPSYGLAGTSPDAEGSEASLEQFSYEPGYAWSLSTNPSGQTPTADDRGAYRGEQQEADDRAARALQSIRAAKRQVQLATNALDVSPGTVLRISDHPHSDLARPLLIVDTSIMATLEGDFSMSARAVFADVPYRPPLRTRRPRIPGPQSAIVVGPENEEIHVDEFGRVRVQFHWDPEGTADDESSCWIRVSQGWAGAGYGMITIPRVGQEVLVGFLDGDPDQPIVVGRVFNAHEQVPYPLPRHKTISTWKTKSTPSSNGFNELKFDDEAGNELVYMQAERDMRKLVKHDESITVRHNRSASIGSVNSIHVGTKHEVTVAQPDPPPSFPPTRFTMIDKKITLTTGEATIELDGPDIRISAKGNITLSAGGGVGITASGRGAAPSPGPLDPGAIQLTAGRTMDLASVAKMTIATTNDLQLSAALNVRIGATLAVEVDANTTMRLASNLANDITGLPVNINGPGPPAARVGDTAPGTITSGSATVFIGGGATGGAGQAAGADRSFATQEEAARAALGEANPQSIAANREFSGRIYRDANGRYHYTAPLRGTEAGSDPHNAPVPPGSTVVGDYHTHGDYSTRNANRDIVRTDPAHDTFNSDRFSNTDYDGIRHDARGNPDYRGYLGTPSGSFREYNPHTDTGARGGADSERVIN